MMKVIKIISLFFFLFYFVFILCSCSGKTAVKSDLKIKGAPEWINKGTHFLNDKNGRLFHGLGQAPMMGDESLQISTADNRARAEVARIFSSFMDIISNDFSSATGSGDTLSSDQTVSQQIRNLTQTNLSGVRIIAHWRNRKDGMIYSLAELDMKHIAKTVEAASDMNKDLQLFFEKKSHNIFDLLSQQTDK